MGTRRVGRTFLSILGVFIAAFSMAQERTASQVPSAGSGSRSFVPAAPDFGTANLTFVRVTGQEFTPYSGVGYANGSGLARYPTTAANMEANFHLPGGAILDYIEYDYCDTSTTNDTTLSLIECDALAQNCGFITSLTSTGSAGCAAVFSNSLGYLVNNHDHGLDLEALIVPTDGSNQVSSVILGYRLQVSPAPGSASFTDVDPSNPFFKAIEALYASGITTGCQTAPLKFCPDDLVTRKEMASFLARALGLQWTNF